MFITGGTNHPTTMPQLKGTFGIATSAVRLSPSIRQEPFTSSIAHSAWTNLNSAPHSTAGWDRQRATPKRVLPSQKPSSKCIQRHSRLSPGAAVCPGYQSIVRHSEFDESRCRQSK
jgi:hypothetical protein